MTDDEYTLFIKGVESVGMIRCMGHRAVPQYNKNEATGAECAACEIERLKEKLANARGWIMANTTKPVHDLLRSLEP